MDLATLAELHPPGSIVTLHRIDPGSASKAQRLEHETWLARYIGRAGVVQRWATGTRGPQVLAWFDGPIAGQWWLWSSEIVEIATDR